jgi:hypothetical protein
VYKVDKIRVENISGHLQSLKLTRIISYIHIHHTAIPTKTDYKGKETILAIKKYHTDPVPAGRGWGDIGYHFIVSPDGDIWIGRDLNRDPASILNYNKNAVAVAILGNFEKEILKGPQKKATVELVKQLLKTFHLSAAERIIFHKEKAQTTCPGKNISKDEFIAWLHEAPTEQTVKLIPIDINVNGINFKGHIINGESFIQLRKFVEAFGSQVDYKGVDQPIKVNMPKAQEKLDRILKIIEGE